MVAVSNTCKVAWGKVKEAMADIPELRTDFPDTAVSYAWLKIR